MEFTSLVERNRVKNTLEQIRTAINQLQEWNAEVKTAEDYYLGSTGMQKLAASCMLIEAIGEGVNQIDRLTNGELLPLRPEIPWLDVIGMRNHIAHGYFDINGYLVFSTVKDDLEPMKAAIDFFIEKL